MQGNDFERRGENRNNLASRLDFLVLPYGTLEGKYSAQRGYFLVKVYHALWPTLKAEQLCGFKLEENEDTNLVLVSKKMSAVYRAFT